MSLTRKNALITIFWSGLNTIQYFLKNIFFISLFLKYRTGQDYGFWIILMSFYGMTVYVCDGYVRYCLNGYNLEYYKDRMQAHKYFSNGLSFLFLISIGIPLLLLGIIQYLPFSATLFNTSDAVVNSHGLQYSLFIIILVSFSHCIVKYISGAIEPEGHIHITNRYLAIYSMCETVVFFLCLLFALSFNGIFVAILLVLTAVNGMYLYSLFRKYKVYKQGVRGSIKEGFVLFWKSLFFIGNNFFEKLTLDGINFMIAILYPPASLLPVYASTRTMANVMVSTSNTFIGVFTIEYQRLTIQKEAARLLKIFHAIWLLLGLCINFGLVLAYPWLTKIYSVWTHGKLPVNMLFFYVIFSVVLFNVYGAVVIAYLKSLNSIRRLLPISIFRAVLIFLLVAIFPKEPIYLALSLVAAEFIVNVILLNVLLYKEVMKMSAVNILPGLAWCVLPFLLTAIFLPVNHLLQLSSVTSTLCMVGILVLVYAMQLKYMKNDLLVSNLQFIRARIFSTKDKD